MKRLSTRTWAVLALLLMAFAGLWMLSPRWMRSSEGTVVIEGNIPGALAVAHRTGASNPNKQLELIIGFKLRNTQALDTFLHNLRDPNSPQFRKFLTPDEFVRDYAPTQADVDKAVRYFQGQGLTVLEVAPNRLFVRVSGTISQIQTVFGVNINTYTVGGVQVYSNDRNPSIPSSLAGVVQGVIGLESISVYHNHLMHAHGQPKSPATNTPVGYGPDDLATAYNYPIALNRNPGELFDGFGVGIAIASAYNYLDSDVQAFWQHYGVNRTGSVTRVYANAPNTQLDGETTLDAEQAGALAPGADLYMYLGHDPGVSSFVQVYNRIVTDNKVRVASTSWGLCEADSAPAEINTEDNILAEAEAQGITFLAAAGDSGAYDCESKTPKLSVDFPASDPHVVAVGGTTLMVYKSSGARYLEKAWSGAGGGVSDMWAHPDWQVGPGVPQNDKRNTSDISLNADPMTGDSLYFKGAWDSAGGTSFGAPALAALFGDATQALNSSLGFIDPSLYRILGDAAYNTVFFDVVTGANDGFKGSKYPGYPAGIGYDHPTGVGSPDGRRLIRWLRDEQQHSANPVGTPPDQAVPLTPPGNAAH